MNCGNKFSHSVPGTEGEGHGPIKRNAQGLQPTLALRSAEKEPHLLMTAYENFWTSVSLHANRPYLGHRPLNPDGSAQPFVWQTYRQVADRVTAFASGLVALKLAPPRVDKDLNDRGVLGLFSMNRPEWVIADQACHCQSIIPIPMYDTLTIETFTYLVNQVPSLKTVVCSPSTAQVAIAAKPNCPELSTIILLPNPGTTSTYASLTQPPGLKIIKFAQVESAGRTPHNPPSPFDVFTFCYTSGTTGEPKGALITHQNLISNMVGINSVLFKLTESDVHLSYLPLPHMMERVIQSVLTSAGGSIGFFQGDPLKILEDLVALRPTVFPSVPRVLNRLKDRVTSQVMVAGGIKRVLFESALSWKLHEAREPGHSSILASLSDLAIFHSVKAKLGLDRVRGVLTGSAPITAECLSWLRAVLGVPVIEGYGMTECTLVATLQELDDYSVGNVGGPIAGVEIKLVDVPEMGYRSSDLHHAKEPCCGRGEIWLRGPGVFRGYYALPEKTLEAVTRDGWLMTGDVGLWTVKGQLKIIDRKKNIFKLAQGEYVAPEKVEGVLSQSPLVLQSFIYGDPFKTCLVGIVVVNPENLVSWLESEGGVKSPGSVALLCSDKTVVEKVLRDIQSRCLKNKLMGFEIPKAIHLVATPWTQGDLLTPTFKLKRAEAAKAYSKVIDEMYAAIGNSSKL